MFYAKWVKLGVFIRNRYLYGGVFYKKPHLTYFGFSLADEINQDKLKGFYKKMFLRQ